MLFCLAATLLPQLCSVMFTPHSVVPYECVSENKKFSHTCRNGDLSGLSRVEKSLVNGFKIGVVSYGREHGHVEVFSDFGASAADKALTFESPAVSAIRRESGEGGDFAVV